MDKSQLRQYLQSTMSRVAGVADAAADPLLQNVASNIQQFARNQFDKEKWEYKKQFYLDSLAKIISELKWSEFDYEKLLTSRILENVSSELLRLRRAGKFSWNLLEEYSVAWQKELDTGTVFGKMFMSGGDQEKVKLTKRVFQRQRI